MNEPTKETETDRIPRVVLVGLASCFGCQINITNIEAHLMEVLGQIDMVYWQLTSSDPLPDSFDVAVIEGAVTTEEAERTVKTLREKAPCLITIGSCAATAGIPAMAAEDIDARFLEVYDSIPEMCGTPQEPRPVSAVVPVDYTVNCCPIDPLDFVRVLDAALYGSNQLPSTSMLCGECSLNEQGCLYQKGQLCLGLVTRSGCGARCPRLGRACQGCAGLSPDGNISSARIFAEGKGFAPESFDEALELFNAAALAGEGEE